MPQLNTKYIKDYKNTSYKNPRYLKEKKQKTKMKIKILSILIGFLLLILIYFLFFSSYFYIQDISISGLHKINQEKFQQIVNQYQNSRKYLLFSRNNINIFSADELIDKIGECYLLEEIKISKKYPNQINIQVMEKAAQIAWLTQNQCYHLDALGTAIESCENSQAENFIKIKDISNQNLTIKEKIINSDFISIVNTIDQELAYQFTIELIEVDLNDLISLKVITDQNYDIYFNLDLPVGEQIQRFKTLLNNHEIQKQLSAISYFDLRFGEKIYYK